VFGLKCDLVPMKLDAPKSGEQQRQGTGVVIWVCMSSQGILNPCLDYYMILYECSCVDVNSQPNCSCKMALEEEVIDRFSVCLAQWAYQITIDSSST
jgi:hypothetical protein